MIWYVPASEPAARDRAPDNLSPLNSEPLVTEYVRAGSDSPYVFDFASAVTVRVAGANITGVEELVTPRKVREPAIVATTTQVPLERDDSTLPEIAQPVAVPFDTVQLTEPPVDPPEVARVSDEP